VAAVIVIVGMALVQDQGEASETFFVDCENGAPGNAGTSADAPWGSVDNVNETTFSPGDTILFRRGTRCSGVLSPKGSGQPGNPITLGAYGTGALPMIVNPLVDAPGVSTTDDESIRPTLSLFNQQYWHVRNLELVGGTPYGLFISGNTGISVISD
jgi:hypothetical protein